MRDASALRSICACFTYRDFIAPVRRIDECDPCASEESCKQFRATRPGQISLDEFDIGQFRELVRNEAFFIAYLRLHVPSNRRGGADEGSGLPSCRIDRRDYFPRHYRWSVRRSRVAAVLFSKIGDDLIVLFIRLGE